MTWLLLIFLSSIAVSGIYGAPYLPTKRAQIAGVLNLLNLRPGELVLDIGCGDGRFLIAAARKGIKGVGYEINPFLYLVAIWRTRKYRPLVKIELANGLTKNWPTQTKGIYIFFFTSKTKKLVEKISDNLVAKGQKIKLVSYAFDIVGAKPMRIMYGLKYYEFKFKS